MLAFVYGSVYSVIGKKPELEPHKKLLLEAGAASMALRQCS
jgi:hypothetical protein